MKRLCFIVLLAFASGCASESPECTIRPSGEPGIRLLDCPTGKVPIVGGDLEATCALTHEDDGWIRVQCSDGTSVLIDPEGNVHYPGSGAIEGIARLAGAEGTHEGIVVRAEGTPFETRTDAEGNFRLGDLPAGLYRVRIEAPGRVPQIRENIPVVNGTYSLGAIDVSVGLLLSREKEARVISSPAHDTLLVVEETDHGSLLSLLHLETWERTMLSSNAYAPTYRFDGRKVLWTENLTSRSKIIAYDVDTGERETLPLEGMGAIYFADGRAVLVHQEAEFIPQLSVYDLVEEETVPLGHWSQSLLSNLPMGPDGGSVVFTTTSQTILYDHENRETLAIAGPATTFDHIHYHPSGRKVAVLRQEATRTLQLIDLSRETSTVLDTHVVDLDHDPTDGSLLWRTADAYKLWEGTTGEIITLPFPGEGETHFARLLPGGAGVVFIDLPQIRIWRRSAASNELVSIHATLPPRATQDGAYLLIDEATQVQERTRMIRLQGGDPLILEGSGWTFGPGNGFLFHLQAGLLRTCDPKTGTETEVPAALEAVFPGGEGRLVVRGRPHGQGGDARLGLWIADKRRLEWLVPGFEPVMSRNGRYLFYRACIDVGEEGVGSCSFFFRLDLETDEYDWIGRDVDARRSTDIFDRFILYRKESEDDAGLYLARAER